MPITDERILELAEKATARYQIGHCGPLSVVIESALRSWTNEVVEECEKCEIVRAALIATDPKSSAANVPIDWARLKTACDKHRALKVSP